MAEYSEAVLTIAKRKAMQDYLVQELDRIVHDDVSLASIQQLSDAQRVDFFNRRFEEYVLTDEGRALLEARASTINEGEYYERSAEEIAEEELRDQWDIAKLESYAIDGRLTGRPDMQQAPSTLYDHMFKDLSAEDRQAFFDKQYADYRNSKEGKAEYAVMVEDVQQKMGSFDKTVDEFIAEHKPFKNRARNRAIIWTAIGVVGLATALFTIPVAIGILGSAAAATGALTVGLPALAAGSVGAALGTSNIIKYSRYASLFRNLKRVATRTDNKGVSLTREMLNKSLAKVHKVAFKLGIAKSQLPSSPIISSYVDDYKPLRTRLAGAVKIAAASTKTAVRGVVAPTEEQKEIKTAKRTVRKTSRELNKAENQSKYAENVLNANTDSIQRTKHNVVMRETNEQLLAEEVNQKGMKVAFAKIRSGTADSNLEYAKRKAREKGKSSVGVALDPEVRKARRNAYNSFAEWNDAELEYRNAKAAQKRNKSEIESGKARLSRLTEKNAEFEQNAQQRKATAAARKKANDEAKEELERVLKKNK
ncbi:MAG: hypothetical protein IJU58_01865 [Clostridia bacterium]|nr:hypothetical protein [Clostridia bacterium]